MLSVQLPLIHASLVSLLSMFCFFGLLFESSQMITCLDMLLSSISSYFHRSKFVLRLRILYPVIVYDWSRFITEKAFICHSFQSVVLASISVIKMDKIFATYIFCRPRLSHASLFPQWFIIIVSLINIVLWLLNLRGLRSLRLLGFGFWWFDIF